MAWDPQVSTDLVSGQVLSYTECRGKTKTPLLGLFFFFLESVKMQKFCVGAVRINTPLAFYVQ